MSSSFFHPDPIGQLMGGYFGQDAPDLYGHTIEEAMNAYLKSGTIENKVHLAKEIRVFITDHPDDLEEAFQQQYCDEFDPTGAGFTSQTFLERLLVLIEEYIAKSLGSKSTK
jgi:hypothetical protein